MRDEYRKIISPEEDSKETMRLVKAADKLSALFKCIEEEQMGNNEFRRAKEEAEKYLRNMELPEVDVFMRDFLPSYYLSLDDQHISL